MGGRWLLGRQIGRGGFAVVHEARHVREHGCRVAVKILDERWRGHTYIEEGFGREADVLATLDCDYVVGFEDQGVLEDGRPYLALELLEGHTLGHVLLEGYRFCRAPLMMMVRHVAAALERLHSMGFVHRDVAPNNIFCANGRFKVIDFGLAAPFGDVGECEGVAVGTLRHMAPEVLVGAREELDGRVDVYGLASISYEALAGVPAIKGERLEELYEGVLFTEPIPVHEYDRTIPLKVSDVLQRALAKRPSLRPATTSAFYAQLCAAWSIREELPHGRSWRFDHCLGRARERRGSLD